MVLLLSITKQTSHVTELKLSHAMIAAIFTVTVKLMMYFYLQLSTHKDTFQEKKWLLTYTDVVINGMLV